MDELEGELIDGTRACEFRSRSTMVKFASPAAWWGPKQSP